MRSAEEVMTVANILSQGKQLYPEKTALIFGDRAWSYRQLDEVTDRLAAAFLDIGVKLGDRVAFLLPNSPELLFCYFACFKIGAIAVPLNIRLKGSELEYIINHSEPKILVSHEKFFPEIALIRSKLTSISSYYIVGNSMENTDVKSFDLLTIDETIPELDFPAIDLDKIAVILYTSGTTDRPKGVIHTHHTLQKTVDYNVATIDLKSQEIIGGMLPIFHIFGFTLQMLSPLSVGATLVLLPHFDAKLVLESIERHRITLLYGLPVMFNALVNTSEANLYDISSLKCCFGGGDAIAEALNDRMLAQFGVEIYQGCGMSEVIPYTLNCPPAANRVGSIGLVSRGMAVRLVDSQSRDVPPGEVGEVIVKSAAMTVGYWQNPAATAELIRDGWLYTGDLAKVDADGYYWFVSRRKEIIIRGGSNISPLEVEAILYQHPAVREAGVIGIPDDTFGETVKAFVALKPSTTATVAELRAFMGDRLASYKVPETIEFLAELPKGLTGKIHRKTLKNIHLAGSTSER
jgi:long-chain acyl-CoA synthetase